MSFSQTDSTTNIYPRLNINELKDTVVEFTPRQASTITKDLVLLDTLKVIVASQDSIITEYTNLTEAFELYNTLQRATIKIQEDRIKNYEEIINKKDNILLLKDKEIKKKDMKFKIGMPIVVGLATGIVTTILIVR